MAIMIDICVKCKEPIESAYTTDNGKFKHPYCYYQDHPFKPKKTFHEVLNNCDDQVLVRDLLTTFLTSDFQDVIINEFNKIMKARHERLIQK